MFENLTDEARRAMALARKEAVNYGHDFIGTEHVLLGVLAVEDSPAIRILANLGVDVARIRPEIEVRIQPGEKGQISGQIPFTPRAKNVLEWAMEAAGDLGHDWLGIEH